MTMLENINGNKKKNTNFLRLKNSSTNKSFAKKMNFEIKQKKDFLYVFLNKLESICNFYKLKNQIRNINKYNPINYFLKKNNNESIKNNDKNSNEEHKKKIFIIKNEFSVNIKSLLTYIKNIKTANLKFRACSDNEKYNKSNNNYSNYHGQNYSYTGGSQGYSFGDRSLSGGSSSSGSSGGDGNDNNNNNNYSKNCNIHKNNNIEETKKDEKKKISEGDETKSNIDQLYLSSKRKDVNNSPQSKTKTSLKDNVDFSIPHTIETEEKIMKFHKVVANLCATSFCSKHSSLFQNSSKNYLKQKKKILESHEKIQVFTENQSIEPKNLFKKIEKISLHTSDERTWYKSLEKKSLSSFNLRNTNQIVEKDKSFSINFHLQENRKNEGYNQNISNNFDNHYLEKQSKSITTNEKNINIATQSDNNNFLRENKKNRNNEGYTKSNKEDRRFSENNIRLRGNNVDNNLYKVKIEKAKISFLDCFVNSHSYKFLSITNEYNFPLTAFLFFEDGMLFPQKPFYFDQHIYLESSSVTSIKINFSPPKKGEFTEKLFIHFSPYNSNLSNFMNGIDENIFEVFLKGCCTNILVRVCVEKNKTKMPVENKVKFLLDPIPLGGGLSKLFHVYNCFEEKFPLIIRLKAETKFSSFFKINKHGGNEYFNNVEEFRDNVITVILPPRSQYKCFSFIITFAVPFSNNSIKITNKEKYEAELVIECSFPGCCPKPIFNLPLNGFTYFVNFTTRNEKFMLFNEHHNKTCFELISDSTFSTSVTVHLLPEFIDSSSQIKHSIFNPPQLLPSHSSSSLSQIWNVLPLEYTIPAKGKLSIQICCNVYKKNNPYNFLQNQFNEAFIKIFVLPNGPFYQLILLSLPFNSYLGNLANYDVYSPIILEKEIVLEKETNYKKLFVINPIKKCFNWKFESPHIYISCLTNNPYSLKPWSVSVILIHLSKLFFKQFGIPKYSKMLEDIKQEGFEVPRFENERPLRDLNTLISFPLWYKFVICFDENLLLVKEIKFKIQNSILNSSLGNDFIDDKIIVLKFVRIFSFSSSLEISPTVPLDSYQNYLLMIKTSLNEKYLVERMSVMNTIGREVTVELEQNSSISYQGRDIRTNVSIGFYCNKLKICENQAGELGLKCMFLIPGEFLQTWKCKVTCGSEKQTVKFSIYLVVKK